VRSRGSIFKRCKHPKATWPRCPHSWTVVVTVGKDEAGKPVQVWRTVAGSKADAEKERTRILRERDTGAVIPAGGRTLTADYLDDWLAHMKTRVRSTTWERYRGLVDRHIKPKVGGVKLAELKPRDVQAVVGAMLAEGAAPRSVLQCYRVLSAALRQAVRWQMIATNPATAVQPPRISRADVVVPDGEAVGRILDAAKGTPMELPVLIAVSTGMRRGEVAGLRWADIDETPDGSVARVTGTLQRIDGELRRVDPKTDRGRRTVALPSRLVDALASHRKEQAERRLAFGEGWSDSGLVLERGDGKPYDPDTFTHLFHKIAGKAGSPGVRFHDLRHAYATTLLRRGVHPKIVSEALGHSSTAFTMDTYSHVVPSMQRAAAEAIDAELG
jgi:integrase